MAELELHFKDMKEENAGLQKNLRDCHVLLVTAKMDPGKCAPTLVTSSCRRLWTNANCPTVSFSRKSRGSCTTKWGPKERSHGIYLESTLLRVVDRNRELTECLKGEKILWFPLSEHLCKPVKWNKSIRRNGIAATCSAGGETTARFSSNALFLGVQ